MKVKLLELLEALDHHGKSLILILVKQTQNFVWDFIIIMTTVICLLMENKGLNLNLQKKMLIFQISFVWEVFRMDLVLLSLEKYL